MTSLPNHQSTQETAEDEWLKLFSDFLLSLEGSERFTTRAFEATELGIANPFPVVQISSLVESPRRTILIRASLTLFVDLLVYAWLADLWIIAILIAFVLLLSTASTDIGKAYRVFPWLVPRLKLCMIYASGKEFLVLRLVSVLSEGDRVDSLLAQASCRYFWTAYLLISQDPSRFSVDYLAAWEQRMPCYVTLFADNRYEALLRVPCPALHDVGLDDEKFFEHLYHVYNLQRLRRGFAEALIPKTLRSIDIVELHENRFSSDIISTVDLGFDGHGNVALLKKREAMRGQRLLIEDLYSKKVIATSTTAEQPEGSMASPGMALHFVSGWDASAASQIILVPTVISIIVSIAWPAVAVRAYGADVQTSVQTGTAIASYIVTAGALLIALAGWYDTLLSKPEKKRDGRLTTAYERA